MELVRFKIQNYRSVQSTPKIPLSRLTALVGPNNEGKSNILLGLVTAFRVLQLLRQPIMQEAPAILSGELRRRHVYEWQQDFPIDAQRSEPKGRSTINLEFRLSDAEITEFRTDVGSNLNGDLPIEIALGRESHSFRVVKRGPGGAALSSKAPRIARFVAERFEFEYIPAVRTADRAQRIVENAVAVELEAIERDPKYRAAMDTISGLQAPILKALSSRVRDSLKEFLPNVLDVEVVVSEEARRAAIRRSCQILIDDGARTKLQRKGDGVQSLAALSLMRSAWRGTEDSRSRVLAIEEPESHLHPAAVHRLRGVLDELAQNNRVIITTHSPLFVNRLDPRANVLIQANQAAPAKRIDEVRDVLGVRAADNLRHAELVLVVEGEHDRTALHSILQRRSPKLRRAFADGGLAIDTLQGGSNLSYKLGQLREALCRWHCFLDDDETGRSASKRAEDDELLKPADVQFTVREGFANSELEDMYAIDCYSSQLNEKYGVDVQLPVFRGRGKWSERMAAGFNRLGRRWDDDVEADLKRMVAHAVVAAGAKALDPRAGAVVEALIAELELRLAK